MDALTTRMNARAARQLCFSLMAYCCTCEEAELNRQLRRQNISGNNFPATRLQQLSFQAQNAPMSRRITVHSQPEGATVAAAVAADRNTSSNPCGLASQLVKTHDVITTPRVIFAGRTGCHVHPKNKSVIQNIPENQFNFSWIPPQLSRCCTVIITHLLPHFEAPIRCCCDDSCTPPPTPERALACTHPPIRLPTLLRVKTRKYLDLVL